MKLVATALFAIATAALLLSCGARTDEAPAAPAVDVAAAAPEAAAPAVEADTAAVEVAAEGTTFEPAISKERLPDGVWYCDMGTVHYARAEEGDGRCATCGMKLVQKTAAAEAPAAEAEAEPEHES